MNGCTKSTRPLRRARRRIARVKLPSTMRRSTPAYRFEPAHRGRIDLTDAAIIEPSLDPEAYARHFYARLRMLDAQGLRAIYIEMPPDAPLWAAVRDRIMRATKPLPGFD